MGIIRCKLEEQEDIASMNTDYYRVILKVIETGNISRTAEILGYTQSGVSHIISKMEKQLNLQILQRERSGITVTKEAESLLPYMRSVVGSEDMMMQEVSRKVNGEDVVIRIATVHSVAVSWLPQLLHDFQQKNPTFRFEVKESNSYEYIEESVLQGKADCGFSVSTRDPGLKFVHLYKDQYYAVMPKGHPLSELESVSPEQLEGYPFIVPEEGVWNKELKKIMATLDINTNLVTKPLDDLMILSMVEKGWGISIVTDALIQLSRSDFARSPLRPERYRNVGMVLAKTQEHQTHLRTFFDFVVPWFLTMKI